MSLNKKFVFYVLNLVFFIIVAILVYVTIYSKSKNMYSERCLVYEKFRNVDTQIDNFATIQMDISEQEDSILDILNNYSSIFYSNDQIINSYKARVFALLKKMDIDIKSSDLKQTQKDENISLDISFVAKYDTFCRFLFELEQFTEVESISYDYKGEAAIKCSPILFSKDISDSFSDRFIIKNMDDVTKAGYFRDIVKKLQDMKNIEPIVDTWREIGHIPESPFLYYVKKKKIKVVNRKKFKNTDKPNIVIAGIMYEEKDPMVIIGNDIYRVGQMYENARIIKIKQNNIIIDCNGKKYTINMEN